jgi:Sugar (and other) transporter
LLKPSSSLRWTRSSSHAKLDPCPQTTKLNRNTVSLSHPFGFWTVAIAFLVVMAVGALPTPLDVLYERRDRFPRLIVTVIFAVYAVGVVASLFLAGHASDWFGRRPVLVSAILLTAVGAAVFAAWPALVGLLVARVLTGVSVGAMTATATAYLAELHAARGSRVFKPGEAWWLGTLRLGPHRPEGERRIAVVGPDWIQKAPLRLTSAIMFGPPRGGAVW